MIRQARKTDFPFVYPILKQIFDEMQMKSIESLPEDQLYSLMKLGFISEDYRYSYRRIWVAEKDGKVTGILDMYPYKDQKIIDVVLRHDYAKTGLPVSLMIKKLGLMNGILTRQPFIPITGVKRSLAT